MSATTFYDGLGTDYEGYGAILGFDWKFLTHLERVTSRPRHCSPGGGLRWGLTVPKRTVC